MNQPRRSAAFTLIELLIVVAIIAILAAIAVPNFLEAQTRSKVARVKNDLRSMTTGLESYRVDYNEYPEGTDNPAAFAPEIAAVLGSLAPGYYALRTGGAGGEIAGLHFATLTTPIAYIASMPPDVFAVAAGETLPYCYRNAKATGDGFILTSVGPDTDLLAPMGKGNTNAGNPLSTASDTNNPARIADINERAVIHFVEGTGGYTPAQRSQFDLWLSDLAYDPTNGTTSDGDVFRKVGTAR